jgi:ADP-ribosylglycohydrolase
VAAPIRRMTDDAVWLMLNAADLETEHKQCLEEGKDLSELEGEFADLRGCDLASDEHQTRAEALLDRTIDLPTKADFPFSEPSDLPGIKAGRPEPTVLAALDSSPEKLLDKALGAWLGRASGCLLGKPAEGRKSWQIEKYLRAQGRWPLSSYFSSNAHAELATECGFDIKWSALFEEGIDGMPEDDDTNYTTTGLAIIKGYGRDFSPENLMTFWMSNIPILHTATAEKVAYRNFANCIVPPGSATFRNPYREWIGAQIRADFFGYVNPGNPELAAEYAWRDASISHVKNGVYGEMWVAAMLSAAYVCDDIETVIRAGLAQIPKKCRLTSAVSHIIDLWKRGVSFDDAIADLRTRWDENNPHDWTHAISNAEIVVIALLWGDKDFEKTICYSVMPGFDTDCNGATSGSVLGVILGAKALPAKWISPLNDTLRTGVAGYHTVSLTTMAQETVELMRL